MILSYMDEAGGVSYAKPDKSRFFIRSAVMIAERDLAPYSRLITDLCGELPSVRGKKLVFHTHRIFHGQGGWEIWEEPKRRELLYAVTSMLNDSQIPVIYACVDKKRMVERYKSPVNPHIMTFIQVGEIVERWMQKNAKEHHWLPCVGANDYNREIEDMFVNCRKFGAPFGYWANKWKKAADVMAFTSAEKSIVFQLSDLCAFAVSRQMQNKEHWGLYDAIESRIFDFKLFPR
jgi:hypothetical protein